MGLFDSLDPYANHDQAQAAADHVDHAGGWHEPEPPTLGREFDPARDDDFTNNTRW